jgi:hypothetical protein
MKNFARFGIGNDIRTLVGYALTTTDRIGPVTLQFENHGSTAGNTFLGDNIASQGANPATIEVKYFVPGYVDEATGAVSGSWTQLIAPFVIQPGGRVNVNAVVFAKKIGIFGSGNTVVSLEIPHPHAAALRGGHIDVEPVGRQGWGFDSGIDRNQLFPPLP